MFITSPLFSLKIFNSSRVVERIHHQKKFKIDPSLALRCKNVDTYLSRSFALAYSASQMIQDFEALRGAEFSAWKIISHAERGTVQSSLCLCYNFSNSYHQFFHYAESPRHTVARFMSFCAKIDIRWLQNREKTFHFAEGGRSKCGDFVRVHNAVMSCTVAFTSSLFTLSWDLAAINIKTNHVGLSTLSFFHFNAEIWCFINGPTNFWLKFSFVNSSWWFDSLKFRRADEFQIEFINTKVKGLNVQFQ